MTKLPQVTGKEAIKALRKVGFTLNRWHVLWIQTSEKSRHNGKMGEIISVPCHGSKVIKKGTLRGIIKDAGLTIEDFRRLL